MPGALTRAWDGYKRNVGRVERFVGSRLGELGALVARKPVLTLLISAVVALAFSLVLPFKILDSIESRSEKLWCAASLVSLGAGARVHALHSPLNFATALILHLVHARRARCVAAACSFSVLPAERSCLAYDPV